MAKAIMFINWTDKDFTHNWDGVPYNFPAKSQMYLQDHLAFHFAKHLTIREMNELGESWVEKDARFVSMMQKCIVPDSSKIEAENQEELETKLMNEVQPPKKKMGRPKKVEVEEETFEGLQDEIAN